MGGDFFERNLRDGSGSADGKVFVRGESGVLGLSIS